MSKCKFWQEDTSAAKAAEELATAYSAIFPDESLPEIEQEPSPLHGCGFCKFLRHGKGYPGEYLYSCDCPGNEKILHVDFSESEVI